MSNSAFTNQIGIQNAYNTYLQEGLLKAKKYEHYLKGIPDTEKGIRLRSILGYLYDNVHKFLGVSPDHYKTEATSTNQIASFVNYGFPMIRSIVPNLAAINLVTVQPLPAPNGYIFHLRYLTATEKGRLRKGFSLFDDLPNLENAPYDENATYSGFENYSSELVDGTRVGNIFSSATAFANQGATISVSLRFTPIRPRTVKLFAAILGDSANRVLLAEDVNGDGELQVSSGTLFGVNISSIISSARLDYGSGLLTIQFSNNIPAPPSQAQQNFINRDITLSSNNFSTLIYELDYRYVSEGSKDLPEVDIILSSAPVTTEPSPMRVRWSIQSQANLKSQYNIDIEHELSLAIANELRYEIDTRISQKIKSIALAVTPQELPYFNIVPQTGVSYVLHKEEFNQTLIDAATIIEKRTGRGTGSWIICGRRVAALVRNLNDFVPDAFLAGRGIRKIGRLKGAFDVYYDPTYADIEWTMGFKSENSFLNTGMVYAPYIAFYATPVQTLDDLVSRQAMYTQYALHVVDSRFYIRSKIQTSRP